MAEDGYYSRVLVDIDVAAGIGRACVLPVVKDIVLKVRCRNGICLAVVNLKVNMRVARVDKDVIPPQLREHARKGMAILIFCYHYDVAGSVCGRVYDVDADCRRRAVGIAISCYKSKAIRPVVIVVWRIGYSARSRIDKA